jgi:hypothetical protein
MVEVAADGAVHAVTDPAERGRKIIGIAEELVRELHTVPAGAVVVTLTSRLDRDLGIDSIGRTELMLVSSVCCIANCRPAC